MSPDPPVSQTQKCIFENVLTLSILPYMEYCVGLERHFCEVTHSLKFSCNMS